MSATLRASMQDHFSALAPMYNALRITDAAPVRIIIQAMAGEPVERFADVGCGSGRYSERLLRVFPGAHGACWDANPAMLDEARRYLRAHGHHRRFSLRMLNAESLPAHGAPLDFIASFNAIHHFDPPAFLRGASRLLRPRGKLFIYTRLGKQNEQTIWGRFFPGFAERERRLYCIEQIRRWPLEVPRLRLQQVREVCHARSAPLSRLVTLAQCRHYSTFALYTDAELAEAIAVFRRRLARHFGERARIEWREGNVMITLQRDGSCR